MKKIFLGLSVFLIAVVFTECDYVANAVEGNPSSNSNNNNSNDTTGANIDTVTIALRKVLIEDYTGHKCGNCPLAAIELTNIENNYGSKIVPLAVHAGFYAKIDATYPADLRTPEGTIWDQTFGISATGNPNGLVNRANWGTSNFILGYTLWESAASPMTQEKSDFYIAIKNTFDSTNTTVNCEVKVKALKDTVGIYNLSVVIVEDSIIGEQTDYSQPSSFVPDYLFMHVMRGSLNSTWGEEVFNGTLTKGTITSKTYNYTIPGSMVPKNCHIVAFIYNADNTSASYYEVRQAEQEEILP